MIASLIRRHEESLAASLAQRSNEREETRQLLRAAEAKMLEARGFSQAVGVPLIASDCALWALMTSSRRAEDISPSDLP